VRRMRIHRPSSTGLLDADLMVLGGLFSGIGGLELGLSWAGIGALAWMCESDPWKRSVLARHTTGVEIYPDVRSAESFPRVDVLCGGFPCKNTSSAGDRTGLSGAQSGLWYAMLDAICAIEPTAVIIENPASGISRWLDEVCEALVESGYRVRPLRIGACDVGAPHRRNRIFVLAVADFDRYTLRHQQRRFEAGTRAAEHRAAFQRARDLRDAWRVVFHAHSIGRRGSESEQPGRGRIAGRAAQDDVDDGPEPRLVRDVHGLSAGLDRFTEHRFPAPRNRERYCFEPSPLIPRPPRGSNRRLRISALGDSVVPQCAFLAGLALIDWMATLSTKEKHV
jgi:DNA (cytosine-5)-methyltransferase 1